MKFSISDAVHNFNLIYCISGSFQQRPLPKDANGPISGYVVSYERVNSGDEPLEQNGTVSQRVVSGQHHVYRLDQLRPWSTYRVNIESFNLLNGERLYSKLNEQLKIDTEVDSERCFLNAFK